MIRSQKIERVTFVILGLFAVVFFLRACGENWWHGFYLGTAVPDARLHVSLAKPVSNYELFIELDRISRRRDHNHQTSGRVNRLR